MDCLLHKRLMGQSQELRKVLKKFDVNDYDYE